MRLIARKNSSNLLLLTLRTLSPYQIQDGRFHLALLDLPHTIGNVAASGILVQSSSSGVTAIAYDYFARI